MKELRNRRGEQRAHSVSRVAQCAFVTVRHAPDLTNAEMACRYSSSFSSPSNSHRRLHRPMTRNRNPQQPSVCSARDSSWRHWPGTAASPFHQVRHLLLVQCAVLVQVVQLEQELREECGGGSISIARTRCSKGQGQRAGANGAPGPVKPNTKCVPGAGAARPAWQSRPEAARPR